MAVQKGNSGLIKIGSASLGEMRSYSIDHNSDTIESSAMGSTFKTYETGLTDFTASIDAYWDEDDTTQNAFTAGAEVVLIFFPEGDASGTTRYTGTAIVTGISRSASHDGLVECSFSVQGKSALVTATS
tara:strand:+ start:1857 stop:2243 length:387 start_codon:yes stop_codon:yes gene_type:complete